MGCESNRPTCPRSHHRIPGYEGFFTPQPAVHAQFCGEVAGCRICATGCCTNTVGAQHLDHHQVRQCGHPPAEPIFWTDLCHRAPKRSSRRCWFGMPRRARSILNSDRLLSSVDSDMSRNESRRLFCALVAVDVVALSRLYRWCSSAAQKSIFQVNWSCN